MKEDFLHYLWKFQKFENTPLHTVTGKTVTVVNPGQHNHSSGPDFFNAQVRIGNMLWAGNVEVHVKSSDWYAHHHQADAAYDNVVLHVVWEHDTDVFVANDRPVPTVCIRENTAKETLNTYERLFARGERFINCERDFATVENFIVKNWLDRLYFERLQDKSERILKRCQKLNNHWEAVLFEMLCKNFGLKVNGAAFASIATSVPFSVVQKTRAVPLQLEAMLMGQAGFLEARAKDAHQQKLKDEYGYLKSKFSVEAPCAVRPKFFRLRPPNFPTVRLAQLAALYSQRQALFSKIIKAVSVSDVYRTFNTKTPAYWETHFNFGTVSKKSSKKLTKAFVDLLVINTIVPIKFSFAKKEGRDITEELVALAVSIKKEANTTIKKFGALGLTAQNAMQSQALLQLKNNYCDKNRCLQCAVGNGLLNAKK